MSVPYGTPPPGPRQPASPGLTVDRREPKFVLAMVAAGAGLLGYIIGFFDNHTAASLSGMIGFSFLVAAALAGMRALPQVPNTLHLAAPLSLYAMLALVQSIVGGSPSGIVVVLLLLVIIQLGALVSALLLEAGIITAPTQKSSTPAAAPRPPARPGQFGPQQSSPFPQSGQFGQGQAPPPASPPAGPPAAGPQSGQQPQAGGPPPQSPQGQPWVPASAPGPGQQPGGWNPQSGGTATPDSSSKPSGPQGTQQMPHPGGASDL